MITGLHDWRPHFLGPDLGGPITDGEEVLNVSGVSLDGVNRSMMLSTVITESLIDFDGLSLISLEDVSLLGTDEVLKWTSIGVVLEGGSSEQLGDELTSLGGLSVWDLLLHDELLGWDEWLVFWIVFVPPEQLAVGGGGDALATGLSNSSPVDIVDWVRVRLLKNGGLEWLDDTLGVTLTGIEEGEGTVI